MSNKVKCLYGEKGAIRMIPEKWANDFKYMQRHGLQKVEIPHIDPIIVDSEDDILEIRQPEAFVPEVVEDVTKEQLYELLDKKEVEYKKTYGIEKLKQLLNA